MSAIDPFPSEILAALRRMRIEPAEPAHARRLTGGVSSDIWAVATRDGTVCVKRALAQLRVAQEWRAPVERSGYEARWMREAARAVPEAVPALLGEDAASGAIAMAYLDPRSHQLWKATLLAGRADPAVAEAVADRLVRIHAATAARPELAQAFPTNAIFHAIRLEPYLLATARRHPDCAAALEAVAAETASTRRAMVHGDVSPKNILVGPAGPVFLDAECAWWGDPAFDLAFCLNHLLLKCLPVPTKTAAYLACFDALAARYRAGIDWEGPAALEARAARLLPSLLLARIDGKSPVEYVTAENDRDRVHRVARALLLSPVSRLCEVRDAWAKELRV